MSNCYPSLTPVYRMSKELFDLEQVIPPPPHPGANLSFLICNIRRLDSQFCWGLSSAGDEAPVIRVGPSSTCVVHREALHTNACTVPDPPGQKLCCPLLQKAHGAPLQSLPVCPVPLSGLLQTELRHWRQCKYAMIMVRPKSSPTKALTR